MTAHSRLGLGLLLPAAACLGGGLWLVQYANAMPKPDETRPRAVSGTVTELLATPCFQRGGRPRRTCFRTVVAYHDAGQARQISSRAVYHPARHDRGQKVEVLVKPDGSDFIADEWEERLADAKRDHRKAWFFPWSMGWLIAGCGAFTLLLAAAVTFWVDTSGKT